VDTTDCVVASALELDTDAVDEAESVLRIREVDVGVVDDANFDALQDIANLAYRPLKRQRASDEVRNSDVALEER